MLLNFKKNLFFLFLFPLLALHAALPFSSEENELLTENLEEQLLMSEDEMGDLEEMIHEEGETAALSPAETQEEASLPVEMDELLAGDGILVTNPNLGDRNNRSNAKLASINVKEVFTASPTIYGVLVLLSICSISIWFYSMMTIRSIELLPPQLIKDLRSKLINNQFEEALDLCVQHSHFFCKMLASGILMRKHGMGIMLDTMKAEGKRSTTPFWQRINLLNEIALIAPMIGLLGTVLGMFYAFYDINRSLESVSVLFDGLGISVGTTVAGLVVAIIAMILHSTAKYRLVRTLTSVENEAQTFAALIDVRAPSYLELP
jgi:biopolymer transport protein ExbB